MKIEASSGNVFADLGLSRADERMRLADEHIRAYGGSRKGLRLFLAACAALAIAGCTHVRYVPIKCISQEQYDKLKQAEPPKIHDKLTGRAGEDIKTIAGSNIRLRAWGVGNLDILSGCVG